MADEQGDFDEGGEEKIQAVELTLSKRGCFEKDENERN